MGKIYSILFLFLIVFFYSCSKENDNLINPPNGPEPPYGGFADTASLETLALSLNNYIPTWKQLERFTKDAQRLTIPSYTTNAAAGPVGWGTDINISKTINYFDQVNTEWRNDISCALYQLLPPYVDKDSSGGFKELIFPISGKILDDKLRAATVIYLREKSLGLPTVFVNHYPPHLETPDHASEADFLKWIDEKFIPEKIAEAKAAELMKAEYFIAWPLEFEHFIGDHGDLIDGGFMSTYSDEQILSLAHTVKNKIRDAVKEHFHGKLAAHSYWNYDSQDSLWNKFDYKGFDLIFFGFFPQINVEYSANYMEVLLHHYKKVIENSGNLPWLAVVDVLEKLFPDGNLEEIEKDLYERVFSKIEEAQIPPVGNSVSMENVKSAEAKNYILNYFGSK